MADIIARPKTNIVRSKIERTITSPILGRRYGGNSSVKDEGTPFSTVADSNLVVKKVISTHNTINKSNINAAFTDDTAVDAAPTKNIVIIEIIAGNFPLQGTKLFVSTAKILSLFSHI